MRTTVKVPPLDAEREPEAPVHILMDDGPDLRIVDESWIAPSSHNGAAPVDSPSRMPTRHPSERPTTPAHDPAGHDGEG